MLVCNVSVRPPRAGIAAEIVETGAALDAATTGNVEFATLVDDPASVRDFVNAYLGEIMVEAASAVAAVNAGLTAAAAIIEAATATDAASASVPVAATVSEPVTAADAPDATVTGAVPSRSAMVLRVFVNPGTSREANANGIMINL